VRLRRKRILLHLLDERGSELPSIEGILVRKGREYEIAVPQLLTAPGAHPRQLDSRSVVVPRERIAFYEILR